MFQYEFKQNYENVFEQGRMPKILKLSNISEKQEKWKHTHHVHDETELIYVAKDKSKFIINSIEYERQDGDMIVIEPNTLHSLENHFGIIWSCTIHDFHIKGMKENKILQPESKPLINAGSQKQTIASIIATLNVLREGNSNAHIFTSHVLGAALTAIYYESFKFAEKINKTTPDFFIKNILHYLNENYTEQIALQNLANKFNVSISYLSHEFAKEYNISPINYIIERRISEAKILLASTNDTVTNIANKIGYADVNHFIKTFTKKTGITPKDYSQSS